MKPFGLRRTHYDSGPNLTSLVDVVMVVLIFLMLAGSFGGATHFLQSSFAGGGLQRRGRIDPLAATQDLFIDGAPAGQSTHDFRVHGVGLESTGDIIFLSRQLRARAEGFEVAGTPPGQIQVVIHPGRRVRYEDLIGVYQAVLRANFTKVAFATAH